MGRPFLVVSHHVFFPSCNPMPSPTEGFVVARMAVPCSEFEGIKSLQLLPFQALAVALHFPSKLLLNLIITHLFKSDVFRISFCNKLVARWWPVGGPLMARWWPGWSATATMAPP